MRKSLLLALVLVSSVLVLQCAATERVETETLRSLVGDSEGLYMQVATTARTVSDEDNEEEEADVTSVVKELVPKDQTDTIQDILECQDELLSLPAKSTLRLVYRVLDSMIQDKWTVGEVFKEVLIKGAQAGKKVVEGLKTAKKKVGNFLKKGFTKLTGVKLNLELTKKEQEGLTKELQPREAKMLKTLSRLLLYLADLVTSSGDPSKFEAEKTEKEKVYSFIKGGDTSKIPTSADGTFAAVAKAIVDMYHVSRANTVLDKEHKPVAQFGALRKQLTALKNNSKKPHVSCAAVSLLMQTFKDRFDENTARNKRINNAIEKAIKTTQFVAKTAIAVGSTVATVAGTAAAIGSGYGAAGSPAVAMGVAVAGAVAGAAVDAGAAIGMGLLHLKEANDKIKEYRREIRVNLLSALEGVATNLDSLKKSEKKKLENNYEDPNCYLGTVEAMEFVFDMLCPEYDELVFDAMNTCIDSKLELFKEHWFSNAVHLKTDYSERYTTILAFISRLSGFDQVRAAEAPPSSLIDIATDTTKELLTIGKELVQNLKKATAKPETTGDN